MKLLFLGTAAAGVANTPDDQLSPRTRRCSSMLVDENALVDVSLHSFDSATRYGVSHSAITDVFLSHTHPDHYNKQTLMRYADKAERKINLWCHEGAVDDLHLTDEETQKINVCPVKCMQKWQAAGMSVTALPANHLAGSPSQQPLHFIFDKNGKKLFYGCDGGWFRADTWEYLRASGIVFDAMILDATVGDLPGNFRIGTHNTIPMLRLLVAAFRENNMVSPDTKLIADHIGIPPYHKYEQGDYGLLAEIGMIMVRDGNVIEV